MFDLWANCHAKWAKIDTYYNRTFQLWPETSTRPGWYRPMRARSIIDHAVDRQIATEPKVHRFPATDSAENKALADDIEPGVQSILDNISLEEIVLPWKQVAKHMMLYGYAVQGEDLDAEVMNERQWAPERNDYPKGDDGKELFDQAEKLWEAEKLAMVPFRTRVPHPARVLMDPKKKRPAVAIIVETYTADSLYRMTYAREEQRKKGRKLEVKVFHRENGQDQIQTRERWSKKWHAMFTIDGEMLFIEPNTWGFQPWKHAFAGYGSEPTIAINVDPSYMAVGLLDHAMEDLKAQAQEAAGRHNLILDQTFNPIATEGDANELRDQLARSDIIEARRGEVYRLEMQVLPRNIFESEQMIDADLDLGTYSRALGGQRQKGVSTVGQESILAVAADRKFITPTAQMQAMATISTSNVLRMIWMLNITLMINGKRIGASMLKGDFNIQVTFKLKDPVVHFQNRELGLRELEAGAITVETYREDYLELENVARERKREIAQTIRRDPLVMHLFAMRAAKEDGIMDLIEEFQDQLDPEQFPDSIFAGLLGGGGQTPPPNGNGTSSADVPDLAEALTPNVARPGQSGQVQAGGG
jgi:hypothetical protein